MKALFKYAIVLGLGLVAGSYVHGPVSLENVAKLNWLNDIHAIIDKALVPTGLDAAVAPDPVAAALTDEELDYRIAQRIDLLDGWRSFLAAHGSGVYAQSARLEVDRLLAATASAPATATVSNGASPDAKAPSDVVGSAPSSAGGTEVATVTSDEICKRDGDRLERLRISPTSDEAQRFANELGCEKLRPQLLGLMESLGYAFAAPAAATPSHPAASVQAPKRRAAAPPSETRWTAPPRSLPPRRHGNGCAFKSACSWRASSWPPILLALLGDRPKSPNAFRRAPANARPKDWHGR